MFPGRYVGTITENLGLGPGVTGWITGMAEYGEIIAKPPWLFLRTRRSLF
jgi:hypothetical protein